MSEYKYFKRDDFACKETGENYITERFISRLDALRDACGFPFIVTSGYRSPKHSLEAKKAQPGTHTKGIAADIRIRNGSERRVIVEQALRLGFGGIGIAKSFVHVDIRDDAPVMWMY